MILYYKDDNDYEIDLSQSRGSVTGLYQTCYDIESDITKTGGP